MLPDQSMLPLQHIRRLSYYFTSEAPLLSIIKKSTIGKCYPGMRTIKQL